VGPRDKQEKKMTGNSESHVAELHSQAAYAHTAAAHVHSTGDHASAQELARKALEHSVEAFRLAEEMIQNTPQSIKA
jgi:hypothetical protein